MQPGGNTGGTFVPMIGGRGGALVPMTGGVFVQPGGGGGSGGGLFVPPTGCDGGALVTVTGGVFVPDPEEPPEPAPGRGVMASTVAAQRVTPRMMAAAVLFGWFIRFVWLEAAWARSRFFWFESGLAWMEQRHSATCHLKRTLRSLRDGHRGQLQREEEGQKKNGGPVFTSNDKPARRLPAARLRVRSVARRRVNRRFTGTH